MDTNRQIKITGAEFNRFCSDRTLWSNGAYLDETLILINGLDAEHYAKPIFDQDEILIIAGRLCSSDGCVSLTE
uniref:hypothetical protein n=1 Tax=Sedimenticola sp. TaxID=1940285 RepID=UPI003D0BE9D9